MLVENGKRKLKIEDVSESDRIQFEKRRKNCFQAKETAVLALESLAVAAEIASHMSSSLPGTG